MSGPSILITGANGQLAKEIKALSIFYPRFKFVFLTRDELPLQNLDLLYEYFNNISPAYCINCAAYTAVDKAETEKELAMLVNGKAVGELAAVCKLFQTKFIHISTDYVFDGTSTVPYKEDNSTSPVNYYGVTKLEGEVLCVRENSETIILRTSWVYSEYGNNFVKTMVRLMKQKESLNVVNDQRGSPTYAGDLAKLLLGIIGANQFGERKWVPGIYHYSNEGIISWYDFAVAIKKLIQSNCIIQPISAAMYPTPAKRPAYSGLDKEKIKSVYHPAIPAWETSLAVCLKQLQV